MKYSNSITDKYGTCDYLRHIGPFIDSKCLKPAWSTNRKFRLKINLKTARYYKKIIRQKYNHYICKISHEI